MTYATSVIKAHLDHFLGEGWSVQKVTFPEEHYTVTLVNHITGEQLQITDESCDTVREHQSVIANVRLFFNRYPVPGSVVP